MPDPILRAIALTAAAVLALTEASLATAGLVGRADDPKAPEAEQEAPAPDDEGGTPASPEIETPEAAEAPEANAATEPATAEQVKQFDAAIHALLIGKADIATGSIQALFDSGITDEQLAQLVDERGATDRIDRAFSRGRGLEGASELATALEARILAGTRQSTRNAVRIEEAVKSLGGTMREQMLARSRLMAAGEFAVPALLRAMSDTSNAKLAAASRAALVDLKRHAVAPLCAALMGVEASTQRMICEVLAEIGYPAAEPFILAVANHADAPVDVRDAAMRAYARLGGSSASAASQFTALARRYFDQTLALIPYPAESTNPVWQWSTAFGLVGTEVPTPLYCETMAVACATRALALEPASHDALAIFVAADLRRATLMRYLNLTPQPAAEGEEGSDESTAAPALLTGAYSAEFFATAAGAGVAQTALAMALDANDPMLARALIWVLAKNASASALGSSTAGRSPLVECLSFADRRVRFDAALVLARALPQMGFSNDSLVIPTLASMVKSGGTLGAVIASTEEDRQALAAQLSPHGVASVVTGGSFSEAEGKIAPGQVIDLVIVQGSRSAIDDSVRALRISRSASTAPVVIVTAGSDASALSADYERDLRVSVYFDGATGEAFGKAVESAVGAAGGLAIAEDEGVSYSAAAIDALHLVAQSSSPVFDIRDAEATLLAALAQGESAQRLALAQVLSLVPTESAQRAIMDAAMSANGEEQAALLSATATSARKLGNQLLPRQIEALQGLIKGAAAGDADAAGALHGALGLAPEDVVRLITGATR